MSRNAKTTPYSKTSMSGDRVVIRPYRISDFPKCRQAHEKRLHKINEFDAEIPISREPTLQEFKTRIERYREKGKNRQHFVFGVFEIETGEFLGQVDVMTLSEQMCWGNLGYHFHNHHWSKGYATEASRLALKISFEMLNFHRIEAVTEPRNEPSIRVAKKAGMVFEGVRKKFFPDEGGIDGVVYAANALDYL